ncbi:MAG TPA: tRNA threonylcarbamoyladenosine dehydratase [Clostridiaceae bacterium]|nr:tRNA threonylcarbamoyladenosine dehydratase [Clostridiaceae bacterium]
MFGDARMQRLSTARVAVFGIGGVGGMAAEALVRSGIGALDIIDFDRVDSSNLNRQVWALTSTLGRLKVDVAEERLRDIAPELSLISYPFRVTPDNITTFPFADYDYVIDAVDDVVAKLAIIEQAKSEGVPFISAMGAGNKLDPMAFEVADIADTSVCPLARVVRRELRKRNIKDVKVVFSREKPQIRQLDQTLTERRSPGSVVATVGAAGLLIAAEALADLTGMLIRYKD